MPSRPSSPNSVARSRAGSSPGLVPVGDVRADLARRPSLRTVSRIASSSSESRRVDVDQVQRGDGRGLGIGAPVRSTVRVLDIGSNLSSRAAGAATRPAQRAMTYSLRTSSRTSHRPDQPRGRTRTSPGPSSTQRAAGVGEPGPARQDLHGLGVRPVGDRPAARRARPHADLDRSVDEPKKTEPDIRGSPESAPSSRSPVLQRLGQRGRRGRRRAAGWGLGGCAHAGQPRTVRLSTMRGRVSTICVRPAPTRTRGRPVPDRPLTVPVHAGERVRADEQLRRHRRRPAPPRAPGGVRRRGVLEGQAHRARASRRTWSTSRRRRRPDEAGAGRRASSGRTSSGTPRRSSASRRSSSSRRSWSAGLGGADRRRAVLRAAAARDHRARHARTSSSRTTWSRSPR